MKENTRIAGARCRGCGKVYVPPPDVCGECYKIPEDWVVLTGEGTIVAITTVEMTLPWSPTPAPYQLALVQLDGADTNLLHLAEPGLEAGDRVRVRFKAERIGSLLDIEGFAPLANDPEPPGETQTQIKSISGGTVTPMEPINSVSEVFHSLPSRFRKEKADENVSFYFSIDDEQWTVLVTPEACDVQPGKTIERADCFLKTSAEIFLGTINGTYTPSMTDLITGKVKTNNPFLLQKFRELFD